MHAMVGLVLAIQLQEKSSSKVSSFFPNEALDIVNNQKFGISSVSGVKGG
jgi:hypothetical protein